MTAFHPWRASTSRVSQRITNNSICAPKPAFRRTKATKNCEKPLHSLQSHCTVFFDFAPTVVAWFNMNPTGCRNSVWLAKSACFTGKNRSKTADLRGWLVLTSQGPKSDPCRRRSLRSIQEIEVPKPPCLKMGYYFGARFLRCPRPQASWSSGSCRNAALLRPPAFHSRDQWLQSTINLHPAEGRAKRGRAAVFGRRRRRLPVGRSSAASPSVCKSRAGQTATARAQ